MIDIDTSAIVTIVFEEPERESFLRKIEAAQKVLVAAVTVLETKMVVHGRKSERGVVLVDDVLRCANFEIIPLVTPIALLEPLIEVSIKSAVVITFVPFVFIVTANIFFPLSSR